MIKIAGSILLFVIVGAYALFNSRVFIAGPQIVVENPQNGALFDESPLIRIDGEAQNISHFHLNNRRIYTDETGNFSEPILLSPGYNIVRLTAVDKFDREETRILEFVYSQPESSLEF